MSTWKVQILAGGSGVWCDSKFRFTNRTEAMQYVQGLYHTNAMYRWRIIEAPAE